MKILKSGKNYYSFKGIVYEEKIIYSYMMKQYLQALVDEKDIVCYIILGESYTRHLSSDIEEHKHRKINRFEKILFYFNILNI